MLRVQADGANPTAVRVRAWKSGTAEPATWKVTASDSTKGPQVAGSLGVRTLNSTTAAATMTIDDFEAKPVPR
jgi:hypothetical protein